MRNRQFDAILVFFKPRRAEADDTHVGKISFVEDYDRMTEIARALSHKFTQDEKYIDDEVRRSGPGTLLFCMTPEHICGKRVTER